MSNISSVYVPDSVGAGSNVESMLLGSMMNGGGMGGGMWNNPIWALVFLGVFANGGFFGGNRGNQCAQDLQLQAIREQLTSNQNSTLLMDAIKGNSGAIANLATNLNLTKDAVTAAINGVQQQICNLASQNGMNFMQVVNAINSGNAAMANQLSTCCCEVKTLVQQQGYEGRLQNMQQSQLIQNGFAQVGYAQRDQTCTIENAIKGLGTQMANQFAALETRSLQDKLQASRDENTALKGQLSNEHQTAIFGQQIAQATAPIVAGLNSLSKEVDDIKCKQPDTVTVPNPPGVLVPNCVAFNALYGGFPYAQQRGNVFS